jgi:predicted  nucleic acid-binding Zn-ribbon protein
VAQEKVFFAVNDTTADDNCMLRAIVNLIHSLSDQINNMDARFSAKFDDMDARFSAKFNDMDARFSAMETRFSALETKFSALETEIGLIKKALYENHDMGFLRSSAMQLVSNISDCSEFKELNGTIYTRNLLYLNYPRGHLQRQGVRNRRKTLAMSQRVDYRV